MTGMIVCYAKCSPCQFGEHSTERHTWMDAEDLEHEGRPIPKTPDEWDQLAVERPCGCYCMQAPSRPAGPPTSERGKLMATTNASTAPRCGGLCVTAADIGIPGDAVAYRHPGCPLHSPNQTCGCGQPDRCLSPTHGQVSYAEARRIRNSQHLAEYDALRALSTPPDTEETSDV